METSVFPSANELAGEAAAQCHSQVQPDITDIFEGFLSAVLCKIPGNAKNPKCPK
jgi:hypothetical protein